MQASIFYTFIVISLVFASTASAQEPTAQAQLAAAKLAEAAGRESQILQNGAASSATTATSKDLAGTPRKAPLAKSGKKTSSTNKARARLREAERLRVRNKYRELQKERFAAPSSGYSANDAAPVSTAD